MEGDSGEDLEVLVAVELLTVLEDFVDDISGVKAKLTQNDELLEQLLGDDRTSVVPAVNQIECHPLYPQHATRCFCKKHSIHVQAYSSLGQGASKLFQNSLVCEVAAANQLTVAQVLLIWALKQGLSIIPKTSSTEHLRVNREVISKLTKLDNDSYTILNDLMADVETNFF